ncbi:bacterio-opsin activator domain-containing protein [Halostella salina]|uniref:bacterio-opsin activator domain-containing protein n=1 Tax=Halostella salina TaxID=1547897 RepID=UPI000EF785F3|nr:bacterio-opsin activator domain-containing protein [Halostella salina]
MTGGASGTDRVQRALERLADGETAVDLPDDAEGERGELFAAVDAVAARLREADRARRIAADRAAALFERGSDPVARVAVDDGPRVAAGNEAFAEVFGEAAGAPLGDCLAERADDVAERVVGGEPVERDLQVATAAGVAEARFEFVPAGDDEGYAVFADLVDPGERAGSERRRTLYEVTSDPSLSSTEKIDRLLTLGCEWFDVDNAYLSRIDADTGQYRVERAVGDEFVDVGSEISLSKTFCRRAIDSADILGIYDAVAEGFSDDRGYAESGIACYIGGRVTVDDELYGTFCFFDDDPKGTPFTAVERTLVDLMARWVSYELERRERERELGLQDRAMAAAPVGITIADATDPDHPVVYANERFETITGYDAAEIREESQDRLYGPDPDPAAAELLDARGTPASTDATVRHYRRDGEAFWAHVRQAPVLDEDGAVTHVVTFREDVTERVRDERRLEALVENTDNPIYIKDRDGVYQWANEATARVFGLDREAVVGATDADLFDAASAETIREVDRRVVETGEHVTRETETTIDGERRVWLNNKYPYRNEAGEVVGIMGISQDITERHRRERALATLHDATRELLTVETESGAADLVVSATGDVLGDAALAFHRFDPAGNELVPTAATDGFADGDPPALVVGGDAAPWSCFLDGDPREFDDPAAVAAGWTPPNDADGGLLVPVGEHGLFVVATPDAPLAESRRRLVETAAASAEAAFDRLDSEADLREREAQLAERNERLERQAQVTDIMRTINQSLVAAESQDAVETAVCEGLAGAAGLRFAWIGGWDADDGRLVPRTWAGDGGGYLDAVSLRADRQEPAVVTAREAEPTAVETVADRVTAEEWREHAAGSGFAAALAVPLAVDDHGHGVLAVYADDPGAFGELEVDVFRELGETIADALEAVAVREALHADTYVELELSVTADESVLARLQAATGGRVAYEGSSGRAGDASELFVSVADAEPDAVADALDDLVAVTDHRHVASSEAGHAFEVTVADDSLPAALARAGGSPRSAVAAGGPLSVVVDVPAGTDVREYVDRLRERYDAVELRGRRNVERGVHTREAVIRDLFDALTERQLEVLRTAFLAGFFEWPRETTGEGVAELLDVSQPTVNRHLRVAQQRLLAELFAVEPPAAVRD